MTEAQLPDEARLPIAFAVATGHEAQIVQRALIAAGANCPQPGPQTSHQSNPPAKPRYDFEVVRTGVGCCALDAATFINKYSAIVSTGFAGALGPGIECGSLLLPGQVRKSDTASYDVDPALQRLITMNAPTTVVEGPLFQTDLLLATAAEKQRAHGDSLCIACDMESALLAQAGKQSELPFACLRIVLDTAEMTIPDPIADLADTSSHSDPSAAEFLKSLMRHPRQLPSTAVFLWHLSKASRALSRSVSRLIEGSYQ